MIDVALRIASQFAPGLVRRLAGDRAGDVAQQILSLGGTITGATDPEEIERRLQADTTKAHEFRMQAASLEVELEKAYLEDRADARAREARMAELGRNDWLMYAVGGIVVAGFISVVLSIMFMPDLNANQLDMLQWLGGGLQAAFMAVVGYFYGSSRGSAEKTRLMSGGGNGPRPAG